MNDIDPKALEHACQCAGRSVHHLDRMALDLPLRASIVAHARAIEQHEAFKQDVSHAIEMHQQADGVEHRSRTWDALTRFIIPKPDPLVEAIKSWGNHLDGEAGAAHIRASLAARGLNIVEATND